MKEEVCLGNLSSAETSVETFPSELWSTYSSDNFYISENKGWVEKKHLTGGYKDHIILTTDGLDIYCKPPDGINEPFFEIIANKISYTIGASVTPTILVEIKNKLYVGSISAGTMSLNANLYSTFKDSPTSSFLATHFPINMWFANLDWKDNFKYNNYVVTLSNAKTILIREWAKQLFLLNSQFITPPLKIFFRLA